MIAKKNLNSNQGPISYSCSAEILLSKFLCKARNEWGTSCNNENLMEFRQVGPNQFLFAMFSVLSKFCFTLTDFNTWGPVLQLNSTFKLFVLNKISFSDNLDLIILMKLSSSCHGCLYGVLAYQTL